MIPRPGETPGAWRWDDTGWAGARVAAAEQGGYGTEFDPAVDSLDDVRRGRRGGRTRRAEADVVFGVGGDFTAWPPVPYLGRGRRGGLLVLPGRLPAGAARDPLGTEADVLPGGHLIALAQPRRRRPARRLSRPWHACWAHVRLDLLGPD